jgi:hypothetical protein
MSQPKDYIFHLVNPDTLEWYYVDATGAATTSVSAEEVEFSPEGWNDLELGWERGWTYFGILTNYVSPIKWVKDGAKIMRYLFYTYGYEAKCELRIYKFDETTYSYNVWYIVDLDFTTYVDGKNVVSVAGIDNGFASLLKSRDNTVYEIDLDGNPDIRFIEHDGINLQAKMLWAGVPASTLVNTQYYPEFPYFDTEGTNLKLVPIDQLASASDIRFVENSSGASVAINQLNLKYDFTLQITGGTSHMIKVQVDKIITSTGAYVSSDAFYTVVQAGSTTVNYTGDVSINSYTLEDDRQLELSFTLWNAAGTVQVTGLSPLYGFTINSAELFVSFDNRYETTFVPCLRLFDLCKQVIEKIGTVNGTLVPAALSFSSTLIESDLNNEHFITSGDGLRRLKGCKIKVTLADLFKFLNVKFGAALYYDKVYETVRITNKSYVFKSTAMAGFPVIESVNQVSIRPFTQESFNNLTIGSGVFTYDSKGLDNEISNGKDEYNNNNKYLTPSVKVVKDSDYVSPIRCDMYGIEQERANLDGKTLADSEGANSLFAIHTDGISIGTHVDDYGNSGDYYALYRQAISVGTWEVENIYSPETAYNIIYTPSRSIRRNGGWFRSIFKFNDLEYFKFLGSGKTAVDNLKLVTKTGGAIDFDEGADLLIKDMCGDGDLIFYPILVDFETYDRKVIDSYIYNDPFGYIEFIDLGYTYKGFLIKSSTKPANMGKVKFTLLLTIDNDITQLIR